ncbi:hypothetical protein K474DRAFT_1657091 [Panus rudis PR-1116 ss-1]|nr:hypothetical protein K474DRAFT_1657091 [Panus rudis PR-1116 ss-1]
MVLKLHGVEVRLVKNITDEQLDELAQMLVFKPDPITTAACTGDDALKPVYFRAVMGACAVGGDLFLAYHTDAEDRKTNIVGCVAFFGPGKEMLASVSEEQRELPVVTEFVKKAHTNWFINSFLPQYAVLSRKMIDPEVKKNGWTANMLAVHPKYQGKGIATELMLAGEALAKANNIPVTLETGSQNTVRMYQHLGYRLLGTEKMDFGPLVGMIDVSILQKAP